MLEDSNKTESAINNKTIATAAYPQISEKPQRMKFKRCQILINAGKVVLNCLRERERCENGKLVNSKYFTLGYARTQAILRRIMR